VNGGLGTLLAEQRSQAPGGLAYHRPSDEDGRWRISESALGTMITSAPATRISTGDVSQSFRTVWGVGIASRPAGAVWPPYHRFRD